MADPIVIGFDPDTKNTAWAVANRHKVFAVGVVRSATGTVSDMIRYSSVAIPGVLDSWKPKMAVVEGQQIYYGGKAPPADIIKLANVAGAMLGLIGMAYPSCRLCLPTPKEWKGETPKPISQQRMFDHYGILAVREKEYCYPAGCGKSAQISGAGSLRKTDWKHVSDAIAIALFGSELLHSNITD